jgi:phosphoribosylformylglycinamidine synthase
MSFRCRTSCCISTRASAVISQQAMVQCFNIEISKQLTGKEAAIVAWLLQETYEPEKVRSGSCLQAPASKDHSQYKVLEVGPRMSFSTAWSANAVSACKACRIESVPRIEMSRRFGLLAPNLSAADLDKFAALVHDRMTEEVYREPLTNFKVLLALASTYGPHCVHACLYVPTLPLTSLF